MGIMGMDVLKSVSWLLILITSNKISLFNTKVDIIFKGSSYVDMR